MAENQKETDPTATVDQEQEPVGETVVEAVIDVVKCRLCEEGMMKRAIIKPYNINMAFALTIMGFLCVIFAVLALPGLVMLFVGIYFLLAKKDVWLCAKCGAMVERL